MASEKSLKQPLIEKQNGKQVDDEQVVKKGEQDQLISIGALGVFVPCHNVFSAGLIFADP
jgi:hypothetical protein